MAWIGRRRPGSRGGRPKSKIGPPLSAPARGEVRRRRGGRGPRGLGSRLPGGAGGPPGDPGRAGPQARDQNRLGRVALHPRAGKDVPGVLEGGPLPRGTGHHPERGLVPHAHPGRLPGFLRCLVRGPSLQFLQRPAQPPGPLARRQGGGGGSRAGLRGQGRRPPPGGGPRGGDPLRGGRAPSRRGRRCRGIQRLDLPPGGAAARSRQRHGGRGGEAGHRTPPRRAGAALPAARVGRDPDHHRGIHPGGGGGGRSSTPTGTRSPWGSS